jgi:hypothetical protein
MRTRAAVAAAAVAATAWAAAGAARPVAAAAPAAPPSGGGSADSSVAAEMLAALATAVPCPRAEGLGVWCLGALGFAKGAVPKLADGDAVALGLTVELARGADLAAALRDKVTLAALATRTAHGKTLAKITSITPSDPEEARAIAEAVARMTAVLKHASKVSVIYPELARYVGGLAEKASYEAVKAPRGLVVHGASDAEIRSVGDALVAVETPKAGDGIFLSLFTRSWRSM